MTNHSTKNGTMNCLIWINMQLNGAFSSEDSARYHRQGHLCSEKRYKTQGKSVLRNIGAEMYLNKNTEVFYSKSKK